MLGYPRRHGGIGRRSTRKYKKAKIERYIDAHERLVYCTPVSENESLETKRQRQRASTPKTQWAEDEKEMHKAKGSNQVNRRGSKVRKRKEAKRSTESGRQTLSVAMHSRSLVANQKNQRQGRETKVCQTLFFFFPFCQFPLSAAPCSVLFGGLVGRPGFLGPQPVTESALRVVTTIRYLRPSVKRIVANVSPEQGSNHRTRVDVPMMLAI